MNKKHLGIIIICLLIAACVVLVTRKKDTGVSSIKSGVLVWVKCDSGNCDAEYQMEKKVYYAEVQEKRKLDPMSLMNVPVDCQQCSNVSLQLAEKCEQCEHVFFKATAGGDYGDKCPGCGHSAIAAKISSR